MQWIELKDLAQLAEIRERSFSQPQVIFKILYQPRPK